MHCERWASFATTTPLVEGFARFGDSLRAAKKSPHTVDAYRRDRTGEHDPARERKATPRPAVLACSTTRYEADECFAEGVVVASTDHRSPRCWSTPMYEAPCSRASLKACFAHSTVPRSLRSRQHSLITTTLGRRRSGPSHRPVRAYAQLDASSSSTVSQSWWRSYGPARFAYYSSMGDE